jgi:predicted amidohydrolase
MTERLRVALGEYDTGWHDPARSLERAGVVVRAAAAAGAHLVVLPEMCTTGFTMDPAQAESIDGPSVWGLSRLAVESRTSVLAGVAIREREGGADRAVNMALLLGPDGQRRATYRKQRVFAYAGEDAVYTPGRESVVTSLHGVRIAPFICYDLRFPELFRAVAREVDLMIVLANWPASRRAHWDALIRARAIENQCYVAAVNRVGEGGGITYDGGSAAFDPWGTQLAPGGDGIAYVDVDPARVRRVRTEFPFLRDAVV